MVALEVHLENFQRVYYRDGEDIDPANLAPRQTTLTKFFELCQEDTFAQTLRYIETPSFYTWQKSGEIGWKRRKNGEDVEGHPGIKKADTLGRIHTVSPNQEEAFCLRLLLNNVQGPTSFDDVKTVNGVLHGTFRDACRSLSLLGNYLFHFRISILF